MKRDPKNEKIIVLYVNLMVEAGHGAEVLGAVQTLLNEHPKNAPLLATLGDLYTAEFPERAVDFYILAFNLDSKNVDYRLKLGSALVRSKQADKGIGLLQLVVRERPNDYSVHANLATAYFSLARYEEATVEYKWVINARPQQAIGYYFLALSFDKQQDFISALPNYEMFLQACRSGN